MAQHALAEFSDADASSSGGRHIVVPGAPGSQHSDTRDVRDVVRHVTQPPEPRVGFDLTVDRRVVATPDETVGLKGYVTNIPAEVMPPGEVIASYHALWQVEASFRMSKTDLRARPMFHHTREAIEAHLTIVFTALALSREVQDRLGLRRAIIRLSRARLAVFGAGP